MDLDLDLAFFPRLMDHRWDTGGLDLSALGPPKKCRYPDGRTIKTGGTLMEGSGEGRGRTKLQLVDWDGTGSLDLLMGTGPQSESAFHSSFVLLLRSGGVNAAGEPVFSLPEVLLFGESGEGLEFWRHCAHPTAVKWQEGKGLVVGSDMGTLEYYHEGTSSFGSAADVGAHERAFRTATQMSRL